ncbi:MAG: UDP-glucose 4-epimerase GalE [Streptosporangiaceae bacterium]
MTESVTPHAAPEIHPTKVLIAGGAGFIGSTIALACADEGITPVILDNLVTGRSEFVRDLPFYEGDVADGDLIDKIFAEHPDIYAVIHAAALIVVPESVADPIRYFRANVSGSLEFAAHLIRNNCTRLVFSSSASVYQVSEDLTVTEDSPLDPQSPYARSKAITEGMYADIAAPTPLRILSLRYFNPIGADPQLRTGLQSPTPGHALGKIIQASSERTVFHVTGTDYPTRDGSGLRDYIHVWDLATAHVAALRRFDAIMTSSNLVINLGTGTGTTVRELVAAFNRVSEHPVEMADAPARPGDVAGAYTRIDRARRLLGWRPRFSVEDGIRGSLRWSAIRHSRLGGARRVSARQLAPAL